MPHRYKSRTHTKTHRKSACRIFLGNIQIKLPTAFEISTFFFFLSARSGCSGFPINFSQTCFYIAPKNDGRCSLSLFAFIRLHSCLSWLTPATGISIKFLVTFEEFRSNTIHFKIYMCGARLSYTFQLLVFFFF